MLEFQCQQTLASIWMKIIGNMGCIVYFIATIFTGRNHQ